jgi:hypothetical protein
MGACRLMYAYWHISSSSRILTFVQSSMVYALIIFLISTVEELSQPTKHANKILVSIFLTVKGTILDTQYISSKNAIFCISLFRRKFQWATKGVQTACRRKKFLLLYCLLTGFFILYIQKCTNTSYSPKISN